MQFTPESSDRGHGWGGDSPGQPLLPWLAALSNSPASSRANAGRPRERTGPSHSHTASISWHDAFPLTTPSVFAPDQVLDTPPGTSGVLIHPPIPLSPQKAWWTHHLSLLHPEAKLLSPEESSFHDLSTDSAASGSKKAGTEQPHAWPALALPQPRSPELRASCLGRCWGWPRALLLARSCSLPGSPLNKQGCIATTALKEPTAPCMGERGSQETVPLGLISSEALLGTGPSQVANLSCGDTRERES